MTHAKVSQFWVSESGASIAGRKQHGYFVVCSCGAEVYSGPSTPYDCPKPSRLDELDAKGAAMTEAEEAEYNRIWKKWSAEWRARLDESIAKDHQNMRAAIEKHAIAAAQSKEAVSA